MVMLSILFGLAIGATAQEELAPFVGVKAKGTIKQLNESIQADIKSAGFEIVGEYAVAQNNDLYVICFTRDDLKETCAKFSDRGALASVLKIGMRKDSNHIEVSLLNPVYMFHAYFGEEYSSQASALKKIDQDAKNILVSSFGPLSDFGGKVETKELEKYHYKVMMPYFDDPIVLEEYDSFDKGLAFIRKKIAADHDINVIYEVIMKDKQTAVIGLSLQDEEEGEAVFLPIIGERHIAAMPYEIILQKNEVSMLHGKYRIALFWPELSMGTFMKIMSTPGDIEDAMEDVTVLD